MRIDPATDRVLAIVGIVLGVGAALIGVLPAVILAMAADGCGAGGCNETQLALGWTLAVFGPPIVAVVNGVLGVVRMLRRKRAAAIVWGVFALQLGLFALGVGLVFGATGLA